MNSKSFVSGKKNSCMWFLTLKLLIFFFDLCCRHICPSIGESQIFLRWRRGDAVKTSPGTLTTVCLVSETLQCNLHHKLSSSLCPSLPQLQPGRGHKAASTTWHKGRQNVNKPGFTQIESSLLVIHGFKIWILVLYSGSVCLFLLCSDWAFLAAAAQVNMKKNKKKKRLWLKHGYFTKGKLRKEPMLCSLQSAQMWCIFFNLSFPPWPCCQKARNHVLQMETHSFSLSYLSWWAESWQTSSLVSGVVYIMCSPSVHSSEPHLPRLSSKSECR